MERKNVYLTTPSGRTLVVSLPEYLPSNLKISEKEFDEAMASIEDHTKISMGYREQPNGPELEKIP